jgi:hypothetical protein
MKDLLGATSRKAILRDQPTLKKQAGHQPSSGERNLNSGKLRRNTLTHVNQQRPQELVLKNKKKMRPIHLRFPKSSYPVRVVQTQRLHMSLRIQPR